MSDRNKEFREMFTENLWLERRIARALQDVEIGQERTINNHLVERFPDGFTIDGKEVFSHDEMIKKISAKV